MIRRARLSFKPNVRPSGRSVGSGARDGVSASQPEESVQTGDCMVSAGLEEKSIGDESTLCVADGGEAQRGPDILEKSAAASSENEPSKPAAAPIQRRKRISTLPNLAKPRVSCSAPVTLSQKPQQEESPPPLPVGSIPCNDEVSSPEKAKVPSSPKSQGSNSSLQGQNMTLPEKRTPIPHVPQFSPHKKASLKQHEVGPVKNVDFMQKEEFSPLKERPSQKSSTNECEKIASKKLVAAGNLEKERIRRAQKLRELLKHELRKERKEWKAKHPVLINTGEQERSKMVMRDFIYFIPASNPMTSNFSETKSEKAATESQLTATPIKSVVNDEDDDLDEEEDDSQLLAPRVKVAEDGSIILDEESLTVEVSRNKAPIVEGNDPIFERGSTTTYSSFRKSNYSKPWSEEETDMFYLAINMVGTDFSMIGQLFPHRERIEIKNKFKREERANSWRIDKAFKERKAFDLEFFSNRLERALEIAKKKRMTPKVKQPRARKATKQRKKQKDKDAAEQVLSDGEVAILSDGADASTEEKENDGSVSVKECLLPSDNVPGKKKRSRKKKNDKQPEEETCESLPEDTTTLPKKPRKSKAADQVKGSDAVDNENLEDVQAAPDAPREKKKKLRKKKSTDKEVEVETTGDVVDIPSPQRDRVDQKSTSSTLPDDVELLTCRESGEPSCTQSEALSCAEESSLILFTEESNCFSEPDDLSSLQDSLSVIPGSLTLADQTGAFDVPLETSQEDSVFETSHHLTTDSPNHIPVEEDIAVESHTPTKVEESSESLIRPAALTRSRLQRPRPNVPVRTLAKPKKVLVPKRDDITEGRLEITADISHGLTHQEDISVIENLDGEELEPSVTESPKNDDDPCPVQKKASESLHIHPEDSAPPEFAAVKEDIRKEKPQVRGRLVRPKPNLKKASLKDKPPDPQPRSPKSDSQYSGEIATVPCSVVLTPLCTSINEEESLVKETSESSTDCQEQCANSTVKPAPLVHGSLQSPKPNTMRTSREEILEDMEDVEKCSDVSDADATEVVRNTLPADFIKEVSTSDECCGGQENHMKLTKMDQSLPTDPKTEAGVNSSEEVQKPTKPSALTRGRLQKPKPNVGRVLPRRGLLTSSDDSKNESEIQAVEKLPESSQSATSLAPFDVEIAPVLAKAVTEEMPFTEQVAQSSVFSTEETIALPGVDQTKCDKSTSMSYVRIKKELRGSDDEEGATPTKLALTRNRLQRPKPNLSSSVTRTTISASQKCDEHEEEKSREVSISTSSMENLSLDDTGKTSVHENTDPENVTSPGEITQSYILPLETIVLPGVDQVDSEELSSLSMTNSSVKIENDSGTLKDERLVETLPALPRSRLQRPKPNLGRSVTRPAVSAPQKCDGHEERKTTKDGIDTSSTEKSGISMDKQNVDLSYESCPAKGHDIQPGIEEPQNGSGEGSAQLEDSSCTGEQVEQLSVKPLRNRLQRPKPNLGRASVRKDSRAFASAQKEVNFDSSSKVPEQPQSKEDPDLTLANDAPGGNGEESARMAIKPAQLKRGRLLRPVPSLGKAPIKRQSALQSKTVNEDEALTDKEDVQVSSSKRKTSECFPDVSSKRRVPNLSQTSSDSAMDLSTRAVRNGSHSNDALEDSEQQHSRFGRQLKKPLSTTPPILTTPAENVSERPEKEKSSRSVKSSKSKVAKPTSSKSKGKTTLVKIRAMTQDEEEEDDAELEFEDEDYDIAPDKLNQAPVFVPFRLRSPKPVPAEIEETVEELEIPMEDLGVPESATQSSSLQDVLKHVPVFQTDPDNKGHCDGSTEAAMALISMGNSVFQSNIGEALDSDHCTENLLSPRKDCKPEPSTLSGQMVCAAEDNSTLHSRPVKIDHDTNSDPHTSEQTSHLLNVNMSCPDTQEDTQQQDCSISDRLLEAGGSEETTFILTLVEIPISEGYSFSCDGNLGDVLPAPVLITTGSSQVLTQDQSSGTAALSVPKSESCPSGQGENMLMLNPPSRKRSASVSSEDNKKQPYKKALLCTNVKQEEAHRSNTADFERNEKSSSLPAEIKTEESQPMSIDATSCSTGVEKVPECTDDHARLGTAAHVEKPASTSYDPPSRLSQLPSSTMQQRPGKKPLGFLPLVCKKKQSKKAKVPSKKNLSIPKCKKAKAQEPEEDVPKRIDEDAPSSEMPSQSSSSVVTPTPTNIETIPSTAQDPENLDTINLLDNLDATTQESPKSQDLATEEEASTVSEYFFSDIFMEVDE